MAVTDMIVTAVTAERDVVVVSVVAVAVGVAVVVTWCVQG